MAITVNDTALSNGMPSAPLRTVQVDADLDASYTTGGYAIAALAGQTIVTSEYVPHWNGAALRWFRLESAAAGVVKLVGYVSTNGAPGVEVTAAVDLSGHTALVVNGIAQ